MHRHHGRHGRAARSRRSGFSLLELSVGLVASSILLVGLTGSMYLATQANRVDLGPFRNSSQAAYTLDEVSRELSYATAIHSITPGRSVEVEIPDRTGDGTAEVLRYEWSGTAGAPLQRTLNGNVTSAIAALQAFDLQAASRTAVEQAIGTITGTSGTCFWYDKSSAIWFEDTAQLQAGSGVGTDFIPKLPEGAQSWSITRVDVRCQQYSTASGSAKARVYAADGNRKPGALLSEVVINESSLPGSLNWYTVNFSPAPTLSSTQRACLTFEFNAGSGIVMQIRYDSFGVQPFWLLSTNDGGNSWGQSSLMAIYVRIYGTYTYPMDGVVDVTKTYQTTLGVDAQVGGDATARMTSSARFRNQVPAP